MDDTYIAYLRSTIETVDVLSRKYFATTVLHLVRMEELNAVFQMVSHYFNFR